MTKALENDSELDLAAEYDFSKGVRGKYAARFPAGSRIVVLAPDVAREFRTPQGVNNALRRLGKAELQVLEVKKELRELKRSLRTRTAVKTVKRVKPTSLARSSRG